jgi:hypothetical protein
MSNIRDKTHTITHISPQKYKIIRQKPNEINKKTVKKSAGKQK